MIVREEVEVQNFRFWLWKEDFCSPRARVEIPFETFQFFISTFMEPYVKIIMPPKRKAVVYEAVDQSELVELDNERVVVSPEIQTCKVG